jgi:hypothetical protein
VFGSQLQFSRLASCVCDHALRFRAVLVRRSLATSQILRLLLRCFGAAIWLTEFASGAVAQAPATVAPLHAALQFGGTAKPVEITVSAGENGASLSVGRLKVSLPLHSVDSLQAEVVTLQHGAQVGVVRSASKDGLQAATLIVARASGLEALWTGALAWSGDPGERRADALEIADRDGDGAPDVVVGVYDERIHVCGEERSLLAPRAIDPRTLTLRSVLLNRAAGRPVVQQLMASAVSPVSHTPPLLRSLRVGGTSSEDPAHPARALIDGDLATAWVEGRGLGGRFEFVTLQWASPGRSLAALAVVPTPSPELPGHRARARVLSLLGPQNERWTATLPEDPRPGQRYWIVPPQGLTWSCLTLSFDDVFADDVKPQTHAMLAEVEAYTDIDASGGLDTLVAEMAEPGTRGDDATQLLRQADAEVVAAAVNERWPRLSVLGKRRALRLLFTPAGAGPGQGIAPAIEILRAALRDADTSVGDQAMDIARRNTALGPSLLIELAQSPSRQGDRAALAVAHSADSNAFSGLLRALLEHGGIDRPQLREALAIAFRRLGEVAASERVQAWLTPEAGAAPAPIAARAALALALCRTPEAQAISLALTEQGVGEATEFAERWRLAQAASALPANPTIDAWLEQVSAKAEPWMLRAQALEALRVRTPTRASAVARRALADDYPRVRSSALKVLADDPAAFSLLAERATKDKWFLVRQAAIENLPDSDQARTLFVSVLSDRTPAVRAAAVHALYRVRDVGAWSKIQPLVANGEEFPEVISEGVAFAKGLCVTASIPTLQAVVTRGIRPEAWTGDQDLALSALDALSAFGGDAAVWARDHAVSPLVPKEMQMAAAAAAQKPASCHLSPAL